MIYRKCKFLALLQDFPVIKTQFYEEALRS